MKLFVLLLLSVVSNCYCEDYNAFIKSLGKPNFGYALLSLQNGKKHDLKSDIMEVGTESFALNDDAIGLFLNQIDIYPIVGFKGFPFEAYDEVLPHFARLTPDVRGSIVFNYTNGGKLLVNFEDFDEFSFIYTPPDGGKEVSKQKLLWFNSEMLSLVIHPLVSKFPSRWNWHASSAIGVECPKGISETDLDKRIATLEKALSEARALKADFKK